MDKFYLGVYKKLIRNNEMIRKWLFIMSFFLLIICNSGYCAPERMGNEESSGASLVETESIGIAAPVNFQKNYSVGKSTRVNNYRYGCGNLFFTQEDRD